LSIPSDLKQHKKIKVKNHKYQIKAEYREKEKSQYEAFLL